MSLESARHHDEIALRDDRARQDYEDRPVLVKMTDVDIRPFVNAYDYANTCVFSVTHKMAKHWRMRFELVRKCDGRSIWVAALGVQGATLYSPRLDGCADDYDVLVAAN